MNNAKSISPQPIEADDIAKRIFVIAILGVVAYVVAVIVSLSVS